MFHNVYSVQFPHQIFLTNKFSEDIRSKMLMVSDGNYYFGGGGAYPSFFIDGWQSVNLNLWVVLEFLGGNMLRW